MEHLIEYYTNSDEEIRLESDQARRIEFITTSHYLNLELQPGSRVLDVGAGAGIYSFHLALGGHSVTAVDPVPRHVDRMQRKRMEGAPSIRIFQGDVFNLRQLDLGKEAFDAVLCLGPLYHLKDWQDKERCIESCSEVLTPGGVLAIAYISPFAAFVNKVVSNPRERLTPESLQTIIEGKTDGRDKFCYMTPDQVETLLDKYGYRIQHHVGSDGLSYFLRDFVNTLPESEYENWLAYHLQTCQERSLLGYSMHGLVIATKRCSSAKQGD